MPRSFPGGDRASTCLAVRTADIALQLCRPPKFSKLDVAIVISYVHERKKDHVRFEVRDHDSVEVGKVHDRSIDNLLPNNVVSRYYNRRIGLRTRVRSSERDTGRWSTGEATLNLISTTAGLQTSFIDLPSLPFRMPLAIHDRSLQNPVPSSLTHSPVKPLDQGSNARQTANHRSLP